MTLHPEQIQALEYIRQTGTEAPIAAIRRRIVGTFEELDRVVGAVPEEVARRRPGAGRWSVLEVVDHLIESHRPAVAQLQALVVGREPEGGPVPAGLLSEDPMARSWAELKTELEAVHRRLVEVFDHGDEATSLAPRGPVLMLVKVAVDDGTKKPVEWVERFDWKAFALVVRIHALEHLAQIGRTLEAVEGT